MKKFFLNNFTFLMLAIIPFSRFFIENVGILIVFNISIIICVIIFDFVKFDKNYNKNLKNNYQNIDKKTKTILLITRMVTFIVITIILMVLMYISY